MISALISDGAKLQNFAACRLKSFVSSSSNINLGNKKDVSVVLKYKEKIVGITTCGDSIGLIEAKIKFFLEIGCDCAICAAHPTDKFKDYFNELKCQGIEVLSVNKIGCVGEVSDWKYNMINDFSDELKVKEIMNLI